MQNKLLKLTHSTDETKRLGFRLAQKISKKIPKNGARVITLKGNLGSGKTTFALGFLKYFGIRPHSASPTFVIMKKYKPRPKIGKLAINNIYHLDAYRLRSKRDLNVLEFGDILKDPKNVILIEWPEKIRGTRFENKIAVSFSYRKKENERAIKFSVDKFS